MFVFIIPLRSSQTASSWVNVSKLFERSLRSACNQSSSAFQVVVVCHELPDIEFSHPSITYIQVDFPAPTRQEVLSDWHYSQKDQNRKIFTGLIYIRQSNPSHVMVLDADDLVTNRLVEYVSKYPQQYGWFIDQGYEYQEGQKLIKHRKKDFQMRCGSSYIIRYDLINPSVNVQLKDIDWQFFEHREIGNVMKNKGTPCVALPFAGGIYVTENSENSFSQEKLFLERYRQGSEFWKNAFILYAGKIWKLITSKPLTTPIRNEFGIYALSLSTEQRSNQVSRRIKT